MSMKHLFNAAAIAAVLFGSTASAETVDVNMGDAGTYYWMDFSSDLFFAGFVINGTFSSSIPSSSRPMAGNSISLYQRDLDWDGSFDLQNSIVYYKDGSTASLAQIAGSLIAGDPDTHVRVSSNSLGATELSAVWYSSNPFTSITIAWNNGPTPAVPEPETWAMLLAGLGVIGSVARRRA